jgi:hypothetical protein
MLFAFEYCCCMLGWLWIYCTLSQEIVPSQLICGLYKFVDEIVGLLPHALWLWILLLHAWVIVDLLFPIARDSSMSTYLWFVDICRWNYWTASSCSLPLNIVVAYFGDCGSSIPYGKKFFQVNLFFRLLMVSTLISCSWTCFSGPKGQHL